MLQSLFGYRPRPAFTNLSGSDIRYFLFGFVDRSARYVFALCGAEDFVCHNLFAVIKHIPNQLFRYCCFSFRRITTEQFFRGYLAVTIKPLKALIVAEVKRHRLSLWCQRRFIVNDDAHVGFFAKPTDKQHTASRCTKVNGTKTAIL